MMRRSLLHLSPVLLLTWVILAGCRGGGGMPMTMEPEPLPTLVGTWAMTQTWTSPDGEARRGNYRLTFVGDRAIEVTTVYDQHGDLVGSSMSASGWEETDTNTVTRLWFYDYTFDDGLYNPVHGSVAKKFSWGNEERSVLFIHNWDRGDSDYVSFHRYERVPEDTLPSPVGSWSYVEYNGGLFRANRRSRWYV